jgi:predicted dehydrogenase
MTRRTNRRQFLKQSSLAGVGFWVAGGLTPSVSRAANEKVNIACIGVGGKGSSDTDHAGQVGNVVALCDIDDNYLNAKAANFPQAKRFHDFRKMLDEMDKQIDAVVVSTPDHTHAPAAIRAMRMGKHAYVQKPLTHTVHEARLLRETAAKMKLATQMGNQGTAENGLRQAVEYIQAGVIGPVREVHVWTNRPIWPQAPKVTERPPEASVPPHVHWDLWLGPAPFRPYALYDEKVSKRREAYHPFNWRGWWDFGTGALGDMGCHTANMAFMALKLGYPTHVAAECGDLNNETAPSWATVTLDFPEREGMPPVKFYWYEGQKNGQKNLPPAKLLHGNTPPGSGSLLVGDKGILYSPNDYGASFKLLPEGSLTAAKLPEPTLPRNGRGDLGMKQEWVEAIKGGPKPFSNFDYAGLLTEAILLGNVAMRAGNKSFQWDGPNLKAIGCPEAEQYIRKEYRKGWEL